MVRWVCAVILAADAFLILVTLLSDLKVPIPREMIQMFDLKLEGNLAVWYSSALLLLVGMAALGLAYSPMTRESGSPWPRRFWTAAALAFIFLSADETAQVHEKTATRFVWIFGEIPGLTAGFSIPAFFWVVLFMPVMVLFVIGMVMAARTWFAMHHRSRVLTLAAVACWAGVVIAEVVEDRLRRWSMERSVQGAIEEGLEIVGATLFLFAFLDYLLRAMPNPPTAASKLP